MRSLQPFLGGLAIGILVTALVAGGVWFAVDRSGGGDGTSTPRASAPSPTASAGSPSPGGPSATATMSDSGLPVGQAGGKPDAAAPLSGVAPAGQGPLPDSSPVTCPAATRTVSNATQLASALASVRPGTSIRLRPGRYAGAFVGTGQGSSGSPIWLCGPRSAVLDGGKTNGGYAFHLEHAAYWRLVGFTVTGGQKGVVADDTRHSVIQALDVGHVGDEGIHLREQSTDNVVRGNTVHDTGLRKSKFGEGIYLGSAVSNWCTYTHCHPDRSDRNVIRGNRVTAVTAEAVDVKEGTTGGALIDNTFDGSHMTGADSWVDVKGNNYLVRGNHGTAAPKDGFQTHEILAGWGDHNVFARNSGQVDGSGYAIASQPPESNVVRCNNTVTGATRGTSNITCT